VCLEFEVIIVFLKLDDLAPRWIETAVRIAVLLREKGFLSD
jgi:hypothetical protein